MRELRLVIVQLDILSRTKESLIARHVSMTSSMLCKQKPIGGSISSGLQAAPSTLPPPVTLTSVSGGTNIVFPTPRTIIVGKYRSMSFQRILSRILGRTISSNCWWQFLHHHPLVERLSLSKNWASCPVANRQLSTMAIFIGFLLRQKTKKTRTGGPVVMPTPTRPPLSSLVLPHPGDRGWLSEWASRQAQPAWCPLTRHFIISHYYHKFSRDSLAFIPVSHPCQRDVINKYMRVTSTLSPLICRPPLFALVDRCLANSGGRSDLI